MAKSFLKPGVTMTRQEKKNLHRKNITAVIPKGRRGYQSIAFKCKEMVRSILNDPREVDWTAIADKPVWVPQTAGVAHNATVCVSNPRLPGKATAMKEALGDQTD